MAKSIDPDVRGSSTIPTFSGNSAIITFFMMIFGIFELEQVICLTSIGYTIKVFSDKIMILSSQFVASET